MLHAFGLAGLAGLLVPALALGDAPEPPGRPVGVGATLLLRTQAAVRYAPDRFVVGFEETASSKTVANVLEDVDADVVRTVAKIDARVVEVDGEPEEALAALEDSPAVEYVEPEVVLQAADVSPNDELWPQQWGPKRVHAPAAWEATRGSAKVVVAVLDTGVDAGHADLRGTFVPGYDLVNNDANPSDDHGHGTAAAGVIAARTNNGTGQAGICWNCSIMPVKVLGKNGSGTTSAIASGIIWAVDHGARVINMSLGGTGTTQALADAVAYATRKGVLLVAAAGNNGSTTRFYPAAYPDVVSVAGTTSSDGRYDWSNYGEWVRFAAPGCNVAPDAGGGYVNFCGTSSATPIVSGIAGLAYALEPKLTKAAFEQALRGSAVPVPNVARYGRVDSLATLVALGVMPPVNAERPSIRGASRVGTVLAARTGRWSGAPTGFAYRWLRCDAAGRKCAAIDRATTAKYRVRSRDLGSRLRVEVRARNENGATKAVSIPTPKVVRRSTARVMTAPAPETPAGAAATTPDDSAAGAGDGSAPPPSTVDTIAAQADAAVAVAEDAAEDAVEPVANGP